MSKQIQVTDNLYQQLKTLSDKDYRTITGQIQYMVDSISTVAITPQEVFTPSAPTALGYPCCSKASPCKHWTFDDGCWTNTLTGAIREV